MNSRAGTMQTGTASRKKPWRLWCPIVMRDGRATLPEIKLDRVPASVTRTYPREIPKLMVGFAVVFIVGIVAILNTKKPFRSIVNFVKLKVFFWKHTFV